MESVLKFNNVTQIYFNQTGMLKVLDNLSFEAKEGHIYALLGPSGCGKTSILNLISGLITPTKGEIMKPDSIGYMFQRDNLFEWLNILDNVTLGLKLLKIKTKENVEYAKNLLKKYGLEDFIESYPKELSGGMRQRVALIRAVVTKPRLLLLDEPFSALDAQARLKVSEDVYQIIKELKITTIIVTHDLAEAISLSDEILLLSSRPAKLVEKYPIKINNHLPLERRNLTEFQDYFQLIWRKINA